MIAEILLIASLMFRVPDTADIEYLADFYSLSYYRSHYYAELSYDDVELMARVVMSEAGGQSMECKEAVAQVLLNRLVSDRYPGYMFKVVDGQFSTADNGYPNDECYQAVLDALEHFGTE